jgi:sugar phosphate isomerase/epimerase
MRIGAAEGLFFCFEKQERYQKMRECGFDYLDLDMCHALDGMTEEEGLAWLEETKALLEEAGVTVCQVHGPWRFPPHDETPEARAERMDVMQRSIRYTAMLGCRDWVIHPLMPFGSRDDSDMEAFLGINFDFFRALLPTARECGVTICFENMPMSKLEISPPEQSLQFIREMNDEHFKFCLDTGHAIIRKTSPADAVRMAGKDLRVLHVHDNDGEKDRHWLPTTGVIDWKAFVGALREAGFDGVFSLECAVPPDFMTEAPMEDRIRAIRAMTEALIAE